MSTRPGTLHTDMKGSMTYTYDGADAAGNAERRGLPTKLTVTRAGTASTAGNLLTFTAAYDRDGRLVKETIPGNIVQRTAYDSAGEPVERSYSGQVTPVTSVVDADGKRLTSLEPRFRTNPGWSGTKTMT